MPLDVTRCHSNFDVNCFTPSPFQLHSKPIPISLQRHSNFAPIPLQLHSMGGAGPALPPCLRAAQGLKNLRPGAGPGRAGRRRLLLGRFFRFFRFSWETSTFKNYQPEDSKHSGSRRIEFSSKSTTFLQ